MNIYFCFTSLWTFILVFYVNTVRDVITILLIFAKYLSLYLHIFTFIYRGTHTSTHVKSAHKRKATSIKVTWARWWSVSTQLIASPSRTHETALDIWRCHRLHHTGRCGPIRIFECLECWSFIQRTPFLLKPTAPYESYKRYLRARPADLPCRGWYKLFTIHFHLTILVRLKSTTQQFEESNHRILLCGRSDPAV